MDHKKLGKVGESLVEDYLIKKGYLILDNNYLKRVGEIDLVTFDPQKKEIAFIEVKTRRTKTFGHPEEAVTKNKLLKIEKAALSWLDENKKFEEPWRIDILSVEFKKEPVIIHLENVTL